MRKKLKKLFTFLLALTASVGLSWAASNDKLPGAFSVSGTKVVYFSKGNLQYQASTNTWRFAKNQYEAVGGSNGSGNVAPYNTSSANESPSDSQTGWIDLFGWAASGISRDGVNAYQPYSTSTTSADYGTTTTKSASETLGNYDWSKNMGDDWRTLTAEEWGYLIGPGNIGTTPSDQRANYQSLRGLCKITVSGTDYPGMIILPDDMYNNLPTEGDIASKWAACAVAAGSLNYTKATFTEAEWTALQAAGAVFLPAAGYRNVTSVRDAGARGGYWSSSASSETSAFYLVFLEGYLGSENSSYRYGGLSVRLVSETAPTPTPSVTAARFVYNYDCQRNPAFPKVNNACTLSGFKDPYEGYKGTRNGNIALGPWKLEFVAYYTPSNNYDCASQVNSAAYQYYSDLSSQEREAKKLEMPIFRLWQYNLTAREYQPAAYGIVCAYAGEANAQDHAALFVSSNGMGCFLSGHQHTSSFALTCENDLTTGLAALVAAASAPSDPYYDVVWPVIVSIDAIGTVELSEHCKYYIEGSRAAYNALTDEQKAQVTNYSTLTDAEEQWADLVAAAQPYADAVIGLINAIPDPVVYTQDCQDKIDAAQDAYDALTDGQKILVTNAETLKNAPSDLIKAAPYVHILFKANGNEKKVENVTLPREFTEAEMSTTLKELYGVEGDYDMYAYSNADAVNISGGDWTIYPFMGKVNVNGELDKYDPQTGYEWFDFSLEISLELPPFGPAPASTDEQVPTNADPVNPSYHYSTFFHSTQNYKLTNDGTQAFIADLSGSDLVLTEIAKGAQVIPANTAVILRKTGSADPVVLTPTEENGVSVNPDDNSLEGVDVATPVTDIAGLTTTNCYVLSGTAQYGVGFYRILGNQLKAHKAYVIYNGSQSNAPRRMRFVFNQEQVVTGIDNANADIKAEKRIENGQLIIIKNGVRYNVQGQVIK